MSEDGGGRSDLEVSYNVEKILDAHTHLSGGEERPGDPRALRPPRRSDTLSRKAVLAAREEYRNMILYYHNAYSHWQNAIHEPQSPRPASEPIATPNNATGDTHRGRTPRWSPGFV
jgi:hypothetical protein